MGMRPLSGRTQNKTEPKDTRGRSCGSCVSKPQKIRYKRGQTIVTCCSKGVGPWPCISGERSRQPKADKERGSGPGVFTYGQSAAGPPTLHGGSWPDLVRSSHSLWLDQDMVFKWLDSNIHFWYFFRYKMSFFGLDFQKWLDWDQRYLFLARILQNG